MNNLRIYFFFKVKFRLIRRRMLKIFSNQISSIAHQLPLMYLEINDNNSLIHSMNFEKHTESQIVGWAWTNILIIDEFSAFIVQSKSLGEAERNISNDFDLGFSPTCEAAQRFIRFPGALSREKAFFDYSLLLREGKLSRSCLLSGADRNGRRIDINAD